MSDGNDRRARGQQRKAGAVKARRRAGQTAKKQDKKAGAVKARRRAGQTAKKQGKRLQRVVRLAGERVSEQTSLAVKEVKAAPDADKLRRAVEVIKADQVMSIEAKQNVFARFLRQYATLFDLGNCPEDYEALKLEAKFLAGMSGHTFVVLAQRLKKIRDRKLYKQDSYPTFKAFIDGELPMAQRTVYAYMDILAVFGEEALAANENVEYTKLTPAVSLLKADRPEMPKAEIKKEFLDAAKVKTRKEIDQKAKELKSRYGLTGKKEQPDGERLPRVIDWFLRQVPKKPTEKERRELVALIAKLNELV